MRLQHCELLLLCMRTAFNSCVAPSLPRCYYTSRTLHSHGRMLYFCLLHCNRVYILITHIPMCVFVYIHIIL